MQVGKCVPGAVPPVIWAVIWAAIGAALTCSRATAAAAVAAARVRIFVVMHSSRCHAGNVSPDRPACANLDRFRPRAREGSKGGQQGRAGREGDKSP